MNTPFMPTQQSLALATSQIHRSRSLHELQNTFVRIAPQFVAADAYGFYLFDENMRIKEVKAQHANHNFLDEYENVRDDDPLFKNLVEKQRFTHSLALFEEREWQRQPLHDFLSRWGLDYSIEAPLVYDGKISGTLNFAIGGEDYFAETSLHTARFLCEEFNHSYKRILEHESLISKSSLPGQQGQGMENLGVRSREILELLLQGLNNRAMAGQLNISENTVRYHIKQIYRVFGVHNRAELACQVFQAKQKLN